MPEEVSGVKSKLLHYEADFHIPNDPASKLAVEIFWPEGKAKKQVFYCIPGGAMNRHYWDIGDVEEPSFSFARQLAARGFVCVIVDSPGLGDADKPRDSHDITPNGLADTHTEVCEKVMADIRAGTITHRLPAIPDAISIGTGHSMGGLLVILMQHRQRQHAALGVLGFGTLGLPMYISPDAMSLIDDRETLRARLPEFARKMFPDAWPVIPTNADTANLYAKGEADPVGIEAIKPARDFLIPQSGYMGMLPGNVVPEAAAIDIPVYLAIGERDLIPRPEVIPAAFENSPAVEFQLLEATGHSHFLFPARDKLFEGIAAWADKID